MEGCTVWPFMSEGQGYRPLEMGKSDQVMSPWAPQPTVLVTNRGKAVRDILSTQIADPQAPNNLPKVEKFDGKAANMAMDRYRNFFKKPPFARVDVSTKSN